MEIRRRARGRKVSPLFSPPHGHLLLGRGDEWAPLEPDVALQLQESFDRGAGHGLLTLGAAFVGVPLPLVFGYWRDFAARYVTVVCALAEAQSLARIDAVGFSRVRNTNSRRISVERLMALINGLCLRTEVAVMLGLAQTRHAAAVARSVKSRYESGYKARRCDDIASSGAGLPAQLLFSG